MVRVTVTHNKVSPVLPLIVVAGPGGAHRPPGGVYLPWAPGEQQVGAASQEA